MGDTDMLHYFAFGSNMDTYRMLERVGYIPESMPGILRGWRLVFNKKARDGNSGYANIVRDPGGEVQGAVYRVTWADIDVLDGYEGYPAHYDRKEIQLLANTEMISAVVYIAAPEMICNDLKPTRDYLNHLLAGKEYLTPSYCMFLEHVATAD